MRTIQTLTRRNIKLFFKDKGMFLTSLITPVILLVLYATFLGKVYRDSFAMSLPEGIDLPEKLMNGLVAGQLISSILAVSCVTVSFCANFLMVQDRANGSIKDLRISPVKPSVMAVSYYLSTLFSALIICFVAAGACLAYVAAAGWYMHVMDVVLLLLDVALLVLFGTALSSVINFFLHTQGQISAVGTLVSSGYGFVCGAYMPISSYSEGVQKVICFLPGTYGTALVRTHAMQGALAEMQRHGVSASVVESIKDTLDCNLYFFGERVSVSAMYLILGGTVALLVGIYVLLHRNKK